MKNFIVLIGITLLLSCGPRTGVHYDEEKKEEQPQFICGNALEEQSNTIWAEKNIKIKGDYNRGRKLFKSNCAVCHAINDTKICGPGLKGVYWRVPEPAEEWLTKFILNHKKVVDSGDPYARKIYEENGKQETSDFTDVLSEQDQSDILIFVISATH